MLNNRQIATAFSAIGKLDPNSPVHMEAATALTMEVAKALSEKLKSNVEVASSDENDLYMIEALTDVLDEVTDEETASVSDAAMEDDDVGDEDEVEESFVADTAAANQVLSNVLELLK